MTDLGLVVELTILVLAIFLGLGLLISGIIEATVALRVQHGAPGRWWVVIFGVMTALAGILVLFRPATGIVIMVVGLLLWFLFAGINDLFVAARSREHRGWNIAMGVLALLAFAALLGVTWAFRGTAQKYARPDLEGVRQDAAGTGPGSRSSRRHGASCTSARAASTAASVAASTPIAARAAATAAGATPTGAPLQST